MSPANSLVDAFRVLQFTWFASLWNVAHELFLALLLFEIVLLGIRSMAAGNGIDGIVWAVAGKLLVLGFWYAVLMNASEWIPAIVTAFMSAGAEAAHIKTLDPGQILAQGQSLALKMIQSQMTWGMLFTPTGLIFGCVGALMILFSYIAIAASMALTLVKVYLQMRAGVLMLGMAGWSGTSHLSARFLWVLVGSGMQLLLQFLVVGAGGNIALQWQQLLTEEAVLDMNNSLVVGSSAVLFAVISTSVPSMANQLVSGGHEGGIFDVMRTASMAMFAGSKALNAATAAIGTVAGGVAAGVNAVASAASTFGGSSGGNSSGSGGGFSGGASNATTGEIPKFNSTPTSGPTIEIKSKKSWKED